MNASMTRACLQWLATGAVLAMLGGAGCQSTGPTVISNELPFDQAVAAATDGLVAQTQKLPAFLAKVEAKVIKRPLLIDPMLDAASGQQTQVTRQLEQRVTERLRSDHVQFELMPFQACEPGARPIPAHRHDGAPARRRRAQAVHDQPRAGRDELAQRAWRRPVRWRATTGSTPRRRRTTRTARCW